MTNSENNSTPTNSQSKGSSLAERLWRVFTGNERSHGQYDSLKPPDENGKRKMVGIRTVEEPTTVKHWEDHLTPGKRKLGINLLLDDGTVWAAVIDTDVYGEDTAPRLAQQVTSLGLPLTVSKSKSGGAHLTLTLSENLPWAGLTQEVMRSFRLRLGLPEKTEIFPKQLELEEGDRGNWINMPLADDRKVVIFSGLAGAEPEWLSLEAAVERYEDMRQPRSAIESYLSAKGEDEVEGDEPHDQLAQRLLDKLAKKLAQLPKNSGRNITLNNSGFQMGYWIAASAIERAEVERVLRKACEDNGLMGESPHEVEATMRSGIDSGIQKAKLPSGLVQPVLFPTNPWKTARRLARDKFTDKQERKLLRRHRGASYGWTGTHWREIKDEEINKRIGEYLEHALAPTKDGQLLPFAFGDTQLKNIRTALQGVCWLADRVEPGDWLFDAETRPRPTELFAVKNGIVNMRTRELLPCSPDLFNHYAAPYDYDPAADCPNFKSFLEQLWPGDLEAQQTLMEWIGYLLTIDTSQHRIMFIVGPSRGGKGTILRLIVSLVGEEHVTSTTFSALEKDTFSLAPFIGKPVAIMGDVHVPARTLPQASERLLGISGGDLQNVNRKFLGHWSGFLYTRFTLTSTDMLEINDTSGALANRLIVLALKNTFVGAEDTKLDEKLRAERPGILNMALDGWARLQERGKFLQPESGTQAANEMRGVNTPILPFFNTHLVLDPAGRILVDDAYKLWQRWAQEVGPESLDRGKEDFGRKLHQAFPGEIENKQLGGRKEGQRPHYVGIRPRTPKDDELADAQMLRLVRG